MNVQQDTVFWLALVCGIATFGTRLLPMLWHSKGGADALPPRLRLALSALGYHRPRLPVTCHWPSGLKSL